MLIRFYENLISILISFSLVILQPYRLARAGDEIDSDCAQRAAKIWLDHSLNTLLTRDNLKQLSKMSARDLKELRPDIEFESILQVWRGLEIFTANDLVRQKDALAAKNYFIEKLSIEKNSMIRILKKQQQWNEDVSAEKGLLEFTSKYTKLETQKHRLTTEKWTAMVTEKIESFFPSSAILSYLADEDQLDDYLKFSYALRDFRQWVGGNMLSPSENILSITQQGMQYYKDRFDPSFSDIPESRQEARNIIADIFSFLDEDASAFTFPHLVTISVLDAYVKHGLKVVDSRQLAVDLAKKFQKVSAYWGFVGLKIRDSAPEKIKTFIPLIYFLRSTITTSATSDSHIKSLLLYDLILQPPEALASILKDVQSLQAVFNISTTPNYAGYIQAAPDNWGNHPVMGIELNHVVVFTIALQLIFLFSYLRDFFPLSRWVKTLLIVAGIIQPRNN